MKSYQQFIKEAYVSRKEQQAAIDSITKSLKWKKFEAVDSQGFKLGGRWHHKTGDGRFELHQTAQHPSRGFAHKSKKVFWQIVDNSKPSHKKYGQSSHDNLTKAKKAVAELIQRETK